MNFVLPVTLLGVAIVMVCLEIYQAAQITWIRRAFQKPRRMSEKKKNTMYNLENTKLAKREKKK